MAAIHKYLLETVSFKNTGKHATTFCKALFTANLRGLYCWRKEDLNNKRKDMCYDVLMSLPDVVRTWIIEERARHIPYFAVMSRRVSLLYFSDALALSLLDHPASARTQMSPSYSNI